MDTHPKNNRRSAQAAFYIAIGAAVALIAALRNIEGTQAVAVEPVLKGTVKHTRGLFADVLALIWTINPRTALQSTLIVGVIAALAFVFYVRVQGVLGKAPFRTDSCQQKYGSVLDAAPYDRRRQTKRVDTSKAVMAPTNFKHRHNAAEGTPYTGYWQVAGLCELLWCPPSNHRPRRCHAASVSRDRGRPPAHLHAAAALLPPRHPPLRV